MGHADPPRDLRATTPNGDTMLNMFHPDLQETLIARAIASGADVLRGAIVLSLDSGPGKSPSVTFEHGGTTQTISGRIVVGADGRASQMRSWAGFNVQRNPDLLTIAGMLIEGTAIPDDGAYLHGSGIATFWAPLGNKRSRTYFVYPALPVDAD
jgi:flavin-dependent dehydrogenase